MLLLRRRSVLAAVGLAAVALLCRPEPARARVEGRFDYAYRQVWSTTVRLLRVDLGFPVTDKDASIGFVLFEYRDGDRSHPGSVELLGGRGRSADGGDPVRVVFRVPSMPSWVERMLVDRLGRKLREDYGDPLPAPRAPEGEEDPGGDDPGEGAG